MKFRAIIGAILALAAAFRRLCLIGIIPLNFSSQWANVYEPYFAAGIVLCVGAYVCYDSIRNIKKYKH